jgi:hypothetical protein
MTAVSEMPTVLKCQSHQGNCDQKYNSTIARWIAEIYRYNEFVS